MIPLYLITAGVYLYYSKSRHAPYFLFKTPERIVRLAGPALLLAGSAWWAYQEGLAAGLLLALCGCGVVMTLMQFAAVLGKRYFYALTGIVHLLLIAELVSYAR